MRKFLFVISSIVAAGAAQSQTVWTMEQCMEYAARHSSEVRQAQLDMASANAEYVSAMADFLPSISAQSTAQFAWGRNVDPETNTYNNVTTFSNGYGIGASLTLFDGGQTINRMLAAKAEKRRGKNAVEMRRDDSAITAMMAFVDAVYYRGAMSLAADKRDQSLATVNLTRRQYELGVNGLPDVAQAEASLADDEYNLVRQQNLFRQAMLSLRSSMNFPEGEPLELDTIAPILDLLRQIDDADEIARIASVSNPSARDAELTVAANSYRYRLSKGAMMPSIYLNAGVSTSYFKSLTGGYEAPSFSQQFRNNRGEYLSLTFSVPLFDNLRGLTSVKRARISLDKAKEQRDHCLRKLRDDISAAVMDRDACAVEIESLTAKVEADSLAYLLNRRRYDEGLLSLTDMQLSANAYYSSQLQLLQKRMLFTVKSKLVDYYKGIPLID